jgi:predicted nucleotidyltransferase
MATAERVVAGKRKREVARVSITDAGRRALMRWSNMDMRDEWLRALRSWASANDSVRQLWLFGSRATGQSRPDSDVDLALALMPPKGKHDWALGNYFALESKWKRQLEEIVGRHVSLQPLVPDSDLVEIVRTSGVLLWSRGPKLWRGSCSNARLPRARPARIVHDRESGAYVLTDSGRAALLAILGDAGLT